MDRPYLTIALKSWWIGAGLLFTVAVLMISGVLRMTWGIPLLFWTGYGVLVVIAAALAIGLSPERRVFWQVLVGSLLITAVAGRGGQSESGFLHLVRQMSTKQGDALWVLAGGEPWAYNVIVALVLTAVAAVTGALAHYGQRLLLRNDGDGFRFTIAQLFAASTLMALSCVAMRNASYLALSLSQLGLEVALLIALGLYCGSHGRSIFAAGFLAGAIAWWALVDFDQFVFEWEGWLPIGNTRYYNTSADPFNTRREYLLVILKRLLPLAAGVVGGVAACLVYRRQRTSAQKAEPQPHVGTPP